jgi:hypothetical protein
MQAHYDLDLADEETLERISWRRLNVLVAGLPPDSATMAVLRQRRRVGDVVADEILESDAEADEFWRQRAPKHLRGGVH